MNIMKMKITSLVVALATCSLASSTASAQSGANGEKKQGTSEEKGKRKGQRAIPAELLEKFDKDGDGKLNDEERAEMRKELPQRVSKKRGPRGNKGTKGGKAGKAGKGPKGPKGPKGKNGKAGKRAQAQ